MPTIFYDPITGRVLEVRMVPSSDAALQMPIDPSAARAEISHEDALAMHIAKQENCLVKPASPGTGMVAGAALAAPKVGRAVDGTKDLVGKGQVTLSASARTLIADASGISVEQGDTITITHDAPEPIKLWADMWPVAGPSNGKCLPSGHPFAASAAGQFVIKIRDLNYSGEPIEIRVRPVPAKAS